jgi:hypothetical protein
MSDHSSGKPPVANEKASMETRWIESEWIKNNNTNDAGAGAPAAGTALGTHFALEGSTRTKEEDLDDFCDLFADPDPYQTFSFEWSIPSEANEGIDSSISDVGGSADNDENARSAVSVIRIELVGYKAELGQTLHSTGLTLWRASELLCQYMVQHRSQLSNRTVLEVRPALHVALFIAVVCHDV